ncbi:uncharacterized protein BJ212DRAFT_1038226 [Suillus subaureus]|uniref:Uncharacterized protein n=1 Tax=Suillus subaureus TaxID=48587 RepID=A0A9P7EGQ5_9AGAM|nr:uncharacterized protein BJ212DRAFT_1038226 [Suillus subaureus]KAG1820567.1 hypothetical protein BJ212DRAFT_1038226 [Suillus subaureus]
MIPLPYVMGKGYSAQYSPVNGADDEDEKLLHRDAEARPHSKSRLLHVSLWLIHGILIFITLLFFTLWARALSKDDILLYSPANEAIESKGIVRFNGSWDRREVYRGSPSPDLEAAWDRVTANGRPMGITLEQLLEIEEEPAPFMARYPEEYGGNYLAIVEVIHHLHCINIVRRSTWRNHYMAEDPDFIRWRIHPDHCVEILRQAIMCPSDVTMVNYDWVEGLDDPYPNFNIPHQCRDFEKILTWVDDRRVNIPPSKLIRQEDNVDLPYPP